MEYVQKETRFGSLIGDWLDMSSTGVLVLAGLVVLIVVIVGFLAFLRGRKFSALLIGLVLLLGLTWFFAPPSWTEGRFDVDESTVSLWLGAAVGVVVLLGVFAMIRLAKPSSWWAQRLYASDKYDRSVERYGWSRIRAR